MNFNGIVGKIASKADTLGKLYGYLAPLAATTPTDPVGGIIREHEQALNALMAGKFPTPQKIISGFRHTQDVFKNGLMAYIAGEVAGGLIGQSNANALKKFGEETMKYTLLSTAILTWDWNPHEPSNLGGGSGGSSGYFY